MTGRFAGPFNLFRGANARERLIKNYAAKLLANTERIVDRPGGSKFQKLVSQHGDLLFTAMVDKTGPRPLYRVFVTGAPLQVVTEEQVKEIVALYVFMESGLCRITLDIPGTFEAEMHYPTELIVDAGLEESWLDWLDVKALKFKTRPYVAGMEAKALTQARYGLYGQFNNGTQSGKTLLLVQTMAGTNNNVKYND